MGELKDRFAGFSVQGRQPGLELSCQTPEVRLLIFQSTGEASQRKLADPTPRQGRDQISRRAGLISYARESKLACEYSTRRATLFLGKSQRGLDTRTTMRADSLARS